ncbi:DUF6691 domain-containing protein [Psychrobacter arenosus]|uniref:DUF6691 family protein n=1 Tax=Psychrobacter arenosus TaxID=256326 RepID=UPI001D12D9DB|nr:DUF6691 family protein [Psychrobacter arenosus]
MNRTMTLVISLIAGMVFGIGLIIAQMVDPNKVVAFLRVFDRWDPSLGLVMGAAIAVAMPAFFYVKQRIRNNQPALNGDEIALPTATQITPKLIIGSMLFGIGWGMLGFCPAPALVTALAGYSEAILFLAAMLVGYWVHAKTVKS